MPVARALSPILILVALVLGVRHGVRLLRSTPAQVQETLHISLAQPTILIVGFLTCLGASILVISPTFFAANMTSATVILYLAAVQNKTGKLREALVEIGVLIPVVAHATPRLFLRTPTLDQIQRSAWRSYEIER